MLVRWARATALGIAGLLWASAASATLIGDEIQTRWQFRASFDQIKTFTVGPGAEGTFGLTTSLDVDASSISVDYLQGIGQLPGTIWTFSDLDWVGSAGEIIGVQATTNWTDWSDSFLSFGDDFVRVDFLNHVAFDSASDIFRLDLTVRHPSPQIPEPGAALAFGLGFLLVGARLRARQRPLGCSAG